MRERGERLAEGERLHVDLLGRAVPVVRTSDGVRAVNKGKPGDPGQVERYLAGKFKGRLEDARRAMAELAAGSARTSCTARVPAIRGVPPVGARRRARWGAAGEPDLGRVCGLKPTS